MADSESVYFPPLETCLTGRTILLSWQHAFSTLRRNVQRTPEITSSDEHSDSRYESSGDRYLISFFNDTQASNLLEESLNGFPKATSNSRSEFDARTSAINVTDPGRNGIYNLQKIKDDALWLASEAKVSEVTALRVVVLEWQTRARQHLLQAGRIPQKHSSARPDFGASFRTSVFQENQGRSQFLTSAEADADSFDDETSRRTRLLRLYLQEQVHLLRTIAILIQIAIRDTNLDQTAAHDKFLAIGKKVARHISGDEFSDQNKDIGVTTVVDALKRNVRRLESGSGWLSSDGGDIDVETCWAQSQIDEINALLRLLYTLFTTERIHHKSITSFLEFIVGTTLFESSLPLVSQQSQNLCRILSASVAMRSFPPSHFAAAITAATSASSAGPLWTDQRAMNEMNMAMLELASQSSVLASIPIYSWTTYVQQSKEHAAPQSPSDVQSTYRDTTNLQFLANVAVNEMRFFDNISQVASVLAELLEEPMDRILQDDIRATLLNVLAYSINAGLIGYEPEVVGAVLALLEPKSFDNSIANVRVLRDLSPHQIVTNYLEPWLELARSRFPMEIAPLLRLSKALLRCGHSDSAAYQLFAKVFNSTITGFTEQLNPDFSAYDEADVDPTKGYFIELKADLPLFISRSQAHAYNSKDERALVLASSANWDPLSVMENSTVGEVLGEPTRPLIVDWNWNYNPMDYIVDWLASSRPGSRHVAFSSLTIPTGDDCTDVLDLFNSMLTTLRNADSRDLDVAMVVETFLDTKSRGFEDETDVITIVFELFEYQIQNHRQQTGQRGTNDLLTQCVDFLYAISYFRPGRIWPFLARSQLLDVNGDNPGLVAIVTNSEMIHGQYGFLASCVKLFERLVELAMVHEATKPITKAASTALTRFAHEAAVHRSQYMPTKAIRNIMATYTRIMISVCANSQFWPFNSRAERASIGITLFSTFNQILRATYGLDEAEKSTRNDSSMLGGCATLLVDLCLAQESAAGLVEPFLAVLQDTSSILNPDSSSFPAYLEAEKVHLFTLFETLLHVAIYTRCETSDLEQKLFATAPALAKLFAVSAELQTAVAQVIDVLLQAAVRHDGQPPSLLGHMGPETAKDFLTLLTRPNQPCQSEKQSLAVWQVLTTVVSSQQQWFALYLLTGKTPRETAVKNSSESSGCSGPAIIQYALDQLSDTFAAVPSANEQGLKAALAMLNFVAQSCNFWPSAVTTMRQHAKFIPAMTEYFSKLGRFDVTVGSMTWHTALGARIAEILTIHLHSARQAGDIRPALSLVNKLGYVKNFAFKPPQHNHAIQSLLRRNVSSLFGNLDIAQFQHSTAFPAEHGRNFFYDVPLAMAMINAARQASGRQSGSHNFLKDFEHTNLDLSKIDVQLQLHEKSKLLVTELSNALAKDTKLDLMEPLLDILSDILKHLNVDTALPSHIFSKFRRSQIDLALTLLQRLVSVKQSHKVSELVDQFPVVWNSVSEMLRDDVSILDKSRKDERRKLLQILFLSLQPLTQWRGKEPDLAASARATVVNRLASSTYTQLLEITSEVVAKGFKALAISIHDDGNSCSPSDFALLTAMLQTILTVPGVETIHSSMVLQLQNEEVGRYATSLYSWADQLLIEGDPIYGELSILFLLELSTIPAMAESLAVDGVLAQLSSANLMTLYSRKGGIGAFDNPSRAHSIWARGILPLCLNLLSAVGGPIAAEIYSFLLQSSPQIARIGRELDNTNNPVGIKPNDTHMTLGTSSEIHTLALLTAAVDTLRLSGSASVTAADVPPPLPLDIWDPKSIAEDLDEWLSARTTRRDWIVPVNERDAELQALKPIDACAGGTRYESRLGKRVWAELQGARDCLNMSAVAAAAAAGVGGGSSGGLGGSVGSAAGNAGA